MSGLLRLEAKELFGLELELSVTGHYDDWLEGAADEEDPHRDLPNVQIPFELLTHLLLLARHGEDEAGDDQTQEGDQEDERDPEHSETCFDHRVHHRPLDHVDGGRHLPRPMTHPHSHLLALHSGRLVAGGLPKVHSLPLNDIFVSDDLGDGEELPDVTGGLVTPHGSHRRHAALLTARQSHADDVEGEVDGDQEEREVGDGDAELERSCLLEVEEGRDGTPGAAGGEAGEVEAGGDPENDEPAKHSEGE